MAGSAVAKVWVSLGLYADTNNILREIFGRYALSVAGKSPATVGGPAFRLAVSVKMIFDMQRLYSQRAGPSGVSISHLIHPQILAAAIQKVLEIREDVFNMDDSQSYGYARQRCFLAKTILSGIRALLLRRKDIPRYYIENIESRLSCWSRVLSEQTLEHFLIGKCLFAAGNILSSPAQQPSDLHSPACGKLDLPCVSEGLSLHPATVDVFKRELGVLREGSEGSEGSDLSFWSLFDILCAAEGSFIQSQTDAESIPMSIEIDQTILTLVDLLQPDSLEESCLMVTWCDTRTNTGQERRNSEQSGHSLPRSNHTYELSAVDDCLEDFANFLDARHEELLSRLSGGLPTRFKDIITSWFSRVTGDREEDVLDLMKGSTTAYVFNCSRLHVVPVRVLEGLVEQKIGEAAVKDRSDLVNVHIDCHRCWPKEAVTSARKIEPFDLLTEEFRQTLTPQTHTVEHLLYRMGDGIVTLETPSSSQNRSLASAGSTGSRNTPAQLGAEPLAIDPAMNRYKSAPSDHGSATPNRSEWKLLHPTTWSTKSGENPQIPQSHCFSADGKSLILWTPGKNHVSVSVISEMQPSQWDWRFYEVQGVQAVAGGTNRIVAVSKDREFLIFAHPDTTPLISGLKIGGEDDILCIAMSKDGNFVSVGLGNRVLFYDLRPQALSMQEVELGLNSSPDSQRIRFSPDGENAIVATREKDGNLRVRICDYEGKRLSSFKAKSNIETNNDLGLSSALYYPQQGIAIVTVFTNSKCHVIYRNERGRDGKYRFKPQDWNRDTTKFQSAAQSPSGRNITFADFNNKLHTLDLTNRVMKRLEFTHGVDRRHLSADSEDDLMSIAMPDEDRVHTFWIQDGKMVLTTIAKGVADSRTVVCAEYRNSSDFLPEPISPTASMRNNA